MHGLRHANDGLYPTEGFLDLLSLSLGFSEATVPSGLAVNCGMPRFFG